MQIVDMYPAYLSDTNALPKTESEVLESAKRNTSSLWMMLFIPKDRMWCAAL